jgi:hypothetical protein
MNSKKTMAAMIGASLLTGGALGLALFGPGLAGAQTTTSSPAAATAPAATTGGAGTFTSNEDPAHEAGESAQREADENSGKAFSGGHHGSNEDPAHEASESPEREAQEDAANAGASSGSTSAPDTTSLQ